MNCAFGISTDDVHAVVNDRLRRALPFDDPRAEKLFDMLDAGAVEKQALRADEIDEQTEAAHEEIERQLRGSPGAMALVEALPEAG